VSAESAIAVAVDGALPEVEVIPPPSCRVAIVHDYITQRGGAERVVLSMVRAFPGATVYTTLHNPDTAYPEFASVPIVTSPLNRIRFFRRHHRVALPLLPWAIARLDPDADVVVVSSSGWSHGVRTRRGGRKLVYCYTPARWLYQSTDYLGGRPARSLIGWALTVLRPWLTRWDAKSARSADGYLAISRVVRERISAHYGLDANVLPAPVTLDVNRPTESIAALADWADTGYHLIVSRLLPYKNVEVVARAFRDSGRRLVIIGHGPEAEHIASVLGPQSRMLSDLSDGQMLWAYQHATAIVAPSREDFGLTPLEGGLYGKPTVALRHGGYLDTIDEGRTGVFFDEPTLAAINAAVTAAEAITWDAEAIRRHTATFAEQHFLNALRSAVSDLVCRPGGPGGPGGPGRPA
jgi:glycosyltransferase involved in cell wall biosynthesis